MQHTADINQLEVPARRRRRVVWLLGGAVVLVGALVLVLIMRGPSDYTIEYVLPNDYRGLITFELDRANGVEPVLRDKNVYVYTIPPSGTLGVKSFGLFERPHKVAAHYIDGRVLRTDSMDETRPEDVALRSVGTRTTTNDIVDSFVFVGTLEAHTRERKRLGFGSEGAKPPPRPRNPE